MIWIIDSSLHNLKDFAESKESHEQETHEWNDVSENQWGHLDQVQESVINSNEVDDFVEGLQDDETLKEKFENTVALELADHLVEVEKHKENELAWVNNVIEICKVCTALFFNLNAFKHDEKDLCEKA